MNYLFTSFGIALLYTGIPTDGFHLPHNLPKSLSLNRAPKASRPQSTRRFSRNRIQRSTQLQHSSSLGLTNTETLSPGIETIDAQNEEMYDLLQSLREGPYFRLYSVDMLGSCEYMPQQLFECYSETCEIYPVDDEEVPSDIRSIDAAEYEFELDGWARFDMPSEDYYDIEQFPEDFTGYDGSTIWKFIHNRIAFRNVPETINDEYDSDNWKSDFNKAVSGLHSMISAQICRGIQEKNESGESDQKASPWSDHRIEFNRRLGPETAETPQALENLYFTYMLLLSAVRSARERLLQDCDLGKIDEVSANMLRSILSFPLLDDPSIQVASKILHDHTSKDAKSLWEARMRTRELFRIMNCVQCNKCRLHGKISAMGLSTAFQILVGSTGDGGDTKKIHRVELAALMTALSKFSMAVKFVRSMLE